MVWRVREGSTRFTSQNRFLMNLRLFRCVAFVEFEFDQLELSISRSAKKSTSEESAKSKVHQTKEFQNLQILGLA